MHKPNFLAKSIWTRWINFFTGFSVYELNYACSTYIPGIRALATSQHIKQKSRNTSEGRQLRYISASSKGVEQLGSLDALRRCRCFCCWFFPDSIYFFKLVECWMSSAYRTKSKSGATGVSLILSYSGPLQFSAFIFPFSLFITVFSVLSSALGGSQREWVIYILLLSYCWLSNNFWLIFVRVIFVKLQILCFFADE